MTGRPDTSHLRRLLAPGSVAVIGGEAAERVVRQCRSAGYAGELWAVSTTREHLAGIPCYPDVAGLPHPPDAAFVSVPREATVEVVADLAAAGAAGAVCHASGFAEDGVAGAALQRDLVAAAGGMALLGPNCLGFVNYLDGVALTPDQHGGTPVDRGVAVVTQSGNIALNLSMQRRSLPVALLLSMGNCAVTGVADVIDALLEDPRVTAIGLHLEELPDVARLTEAAVRAQQAGVPLVALKTGSSRLGRAATASHTSALATPEVLSDALFARLGIARVRSLSAFVETLLLLHVHGPLPGARVTSASCSGGEAAHLADLAEALGVPVPPLPVEIAARLHDVLGERVVVGNPLDYHTWIWDDREALTRCFTALQSADADLHLLLLDLPRDERCDGSSYTTALEAWLAARRATGARTCVVASLPENLPERVGDRLLAEGVAPLHGLGDALTAVLAAREVGSVRVTAVTGRLGAPSPTGVAPHRGVPCPVDAHDGGPLDEAAAKRLLAAHGVPVPAGEVVAAADTAHAAARLGYPVVVKAVAPGLAHKSDVGGVRLGLTSAGQVRAAVADLADLGDRFLVERMVDGVVAELVVGVGRDPQVGPYLTLGAGGVLVELLSDSATLLLPADPEEVVAALRGLRVWPLLAGFRGPGADVAGVVDAVGRIAACAEAVGDRLLDLEVNPLLALTDGAVAVDAFLRLTPRATPPATPPTADDVSPRSTQEVLR